MPAIKRVVIKGPEYFEKIIRPTLGDILPETNIFSGPLGEFTVLDDVSESADIFDFAEFGNILQRRDASCEIKFSPLGKATARKVFTAELAAATKFCRQAFYQGALKDWRKGDPLFGNKILPWFRRAWQTDLVGNMYFGDITRVDAANARYSTNEFDGILTQYRKFIASGAIPGGQTFNVPNGDITPANAYAYLKSLYDKQPMEMGLFTPTEKAIYIDQAWFDAYEEYLTQTNSGTTEHANAIQNGTRVRAFKGIPVIVNKWFGPILFQIAGAVAHFGVLTVRGNFVFATDKDYGEGPNGDQALAVWYSWDELVWKYLQVLKAGTTIIAPELSTLALPA